MIIRTPLFWISFRIRWLPSPTKSATKYRTRYMRAGCAADLYTGIAGILLDKFFASISLSSIACQRSSHLLLASFLYPSSCFFFSIHIRMHGSLAWQASAANISECDLALIPLLYPLDLNNGPRANLPSSVTVNLRARSAEFNRAARNLSPENPERTFRPKIHYLFT